MGQKIPAGSRGVCKVVVIGFITLVAVAVNFAAVAGPQGRRRHVFLVAAGCSGILALAGLMLALSVPLRALP